MTKITHIVVHYTATYEDQNLTAADIDRMHRARGWKKIGYHWVIRRDGTIEKGRPESEVGAHVGGQNTGKIGIAWIGGLNRATGPNVGVDNRTPAQTNSLIKLIDECLERYPDAKVVGHRDLAATQCPGFDVPAWWSMEEKRQTPPLLNAPVTTPGVGEDKVHVVEKGDTLWSIAREYGISVDKLVELNPSVRENALKIGSELVLTARRSRKDVLAEVRVLLDELETL